MSERLFETALEKDRKASRLSRGAEGEESASGLQEYQLKLLIQKLGKSKVQS